MSKFSQPWNVVFFAGFLVYLGIRGKFARQVKRNELTVRQVDALEKVLMVFTIGGSTLPILLHFFTAWLSFADYRLPTPAPWCGVAVMLLALWLFSLAQALLLANWLAGCAALVTFAPMYFLRTPREERMMCEIFGQEYRDYMARTGRLWPRIGAKPDA